MNTEFSVVFPLQQWLREHATMLCYMCTVYFSVFVLGGWVSSEQTAVSPFSAATTFAGRALLCTHTHVRICRER
jgi:hypothetical protein